MPVEISPLIRVRAKNCIVLSLCYKIQTISFMSSEFIYLKRIMFFAVLAIRAANSRGYIWIQKK